MEKKTNTSAIWGFWLALTSLLIFGFLALPAFICSIVGYSKACNELQGSGRGMAFAGIIMSAIAGIFWLWLFFSFMAGVGQSLEELSSYSSLLLV